MALDGKALRILRFVEGVTVTNLASALGVSPSYISQIESNTRKPSKEFALRYLEALNREPSKEGVKT